MWSMEHAANYLEFIDGLEFGIKREYRNEKRLIEEVSKFKEAYANGLVDGEDYHDFLNRFGPFLDIKKPSFVDNMKFTYNCNHSVYLTYYIYFFSPI